MPADPLQGPHPGISTYAVTLPFLLPWLDRQHNAIIRTHAQEFHKAGKGCGPDHYFQEEWTELGQ